MQTLLRSQVRSMRVVSVVPEANCRFCELRLGFILLCRSRAILSPYIFIEIGGGFFCFFGPEIVSGRVIGD